MTLTAGGSGADEPDLQSGERDAADILDLHGDLERNATSNTSVALSEQQRLNATVPASVTVNSGSTTANFTLTPTAVSSSHGSDHGNAEQLASKTFSETLLP